MHAEVIAKVQAHFKEFGKINYKEEIIKLEHRWSKCNDILGEYIEK